MEPLIDALKKFIISPIVYVLTQQKKKLFFFLSFMLLWLVLLFPNSDTKNFLEQKVSSLSKGQINLELDKLSLTPIPLGIKLVSPSVRINGKKPLKPITADSIIVAPKISSLLAFKLGATVYLKNLLGGNGSISATLLGKNKEKSNMFSSSGDMKNFLVQEILTVLGQDLKIPGTVELEYELKGEDSFRKQPSGDFKARILDLKLPNPLNTPAGPFDFPKRIVWKNSNLFGKIENGKLNVTEGTLGTKASEINGRFKGNVDFNVRKVGPNISANFGRYEFSVELELSKDFEKEIGAVLSAAISGVNKTSAPNGGKKYLFRVTGRVPGSGYAPPPKFSSLSSFSTEE